MPCTPAQAQDWFARRGWQAFDFQRQVWAAMAAGRSGLLHANTGAGKTLAAWLGALARSQALGGTSTVQPPPLQVLWLTPMRALAADTQRALALPATELALHWTIGLRPQLQVLSAPSPFALALMVERFREQLSTENLADRLARIVADAEALLGTAKPPPSARTPRRA